MKRIVFVTTQQLTGSTVAGRIFPLAREIAKEHEVHILVMAGAVLVSEKNIHIHTIGKEPFLRTPNGKIRLKGVALIARLKINALLAATKIIRLQPDVIIISKPLPQNVLGVVLAKPFIKSRVILDTDDYELTANKIISFIQRAAVQWGQFTAAKISEHIIVATPFLQDIWQQLTNSKKTVTLVPTGVNAPPTLTKSDAQIVYLGSISFHSGHRLDMVPDVMSRVRQRHPHVPVVIAGDGEDEEQLKQAFQKKNITNVKWLGRFTPERVAEILTTQSIIIDPIDNSVTNRAKSSYRVALSLALGLPVVTSNIGIRSQLIPNQLHSKFFAKAGDIQDMAQKIDALLTTPLTVEERSHLTSQAKRYTWEVLAKEYCHAIQL